MVVVKDGRKERRGEERRGEERRREDGYRTRMNVVGEGEN